MPLNQQQKTAIDLIGSDLGHFVTIDIDDNTRVTGRLTGVTLAMHSDVTLYTWTTKQKVEKPVSTILIDQVGELTIPGSTPVTVML